MRVAHSAINRADTLQRQGGYPDPRRRDVEILGLEYAGTVEAIGERVTAWKVGDAVMGIEAGACNAELVTTHERQAMPVPPTALCPALFVLPPWGLDPATPDIAPPVATELVPPLVEPAVLELAVPLLPLAPPPTELEPAGGPLGSRG